MYPIVEGKKNRKLAAQGLVEFAIILPVVLITVFVLIELARVMHAWLTVENGARIGVRYAVTAEYNPENCGVDGYDAEGKCIKEADEPGARVDSIHEAAWAGSSSIVRVGIGEADPDEASYFNVIVCDPEDLIMPGSTFDVHSCPPAEDPGGPGEQVIVVVEFNHPVLLPFLNTVWPELRLTARREATVENYRVPPAVGTAPIFNSPTPNPTNTPGPTPTSSSPIPPPSCGNVWISGVTADDDAGIIGFEIRAYDDADMPAGANYRIQVKEVEVWQDEDAPPWDMDGFEWVTWDAGGGTDSRDITYGGSGNYVSFYTPSPYFDIGHCYGSAACPSYHYRGRLTTYFSQPLLGEYSIFPVVYFPDYGLECKKWVDHKTPLWPTDTPVPSDPIPDETNTPTPWVPITDTPTPVSGGPSDG